MEEDRMVLDSEDQAEIHPKISNEKRFWERRLEYGVIRLKSKIQKLRNKKKQDRTLKLLTTDLNNVNLTVGAKEKNISSDVNRIKVGSLLDLVTQYSPKNEAVWLESSRLASPVEAKQVIVRGLKAIPDSVNLWMKAASLESGNVDKMRVLMKGIESVPSSIRLWKEVVGIANEDDGKFLLCKAVECCPLCVEFWLALACLQKSYDEGKMVLDKAKEKLPKDPNLRRAGCVLEKTKDITAMVGMITVIGAHTLRVAEFLDADGAGLANEALVEGDGSVASWEVIKVLMYNASWELRLPKVSHSRRRAPCKSSPVNSR